MCRIFPTIVRPTKMAQETDDINLTPQELQTLSELDSRQFGFLKLNSAEQSKKKALVVRAVKYLERMLVQAQSEKQRRKADSTKLSSEESKDEDEDKGISIDPKTYCKLGHFHLLLEDYSKAMSAYQKFYTLKGDYWKDASFLYGQGLVYFHFNAFQWSEVEMSLVARQMKNWSLFDAEVYVPKSSSWMAVAKGVE